MTNNTKITNVVLLLGIVIFFIYVYVTNVYYRPKAIKNNGIVLNAWTLEWKFDSKGSRSLQYEFYYNTKKIIGYTTPRNNRGNINFVHSYFPVIYDTIDGYKEILIDPKNFKRYNIAFPDSLKWVLKYFDD